MIVHATAPYEDAGRGVGLAIAGVAAASAGALIAIGLIGYSVVVVVRATMWPLWNPVGRLVGLTGLDGLNARNWDRVFDALGALAASLVVEGVVTLGVVVPGADTHAALDQMLLEILHIVRRRSLWRSP